MPSVTLIVNRNARGLRAASLPRALSALPCRIVETRALHELETSAASVVEERPSLVILAGGDGSVMEGISSLTRACESKGVPMPRIAIVPAGTFSTIANNLGLPRSPLPYATALVEAALAGRERSRRHATLRVRDAAGSHRVGFIFGTGLVAEFFEQYDSQPSPDTLSAIGLVGRLFVGAITGSALAARVLTPMPMSLTIDGSPLPHGRYSLVVSSVLRDVGLHLRPTRRAGEDDARVHVVASTRSARHLALQLPIVLAARKMRGDGYVDELAESFRVTFDGTLRSYVLDGDRIVAGEREGRSWVDVARGPDVELVSLE